MNRLLKMLWIISFIGISNAALAGPNADVGTVIGGIAGGLVGNNIVHGDAKTAATIGGAVIGSVVGNQVGAAADRQNYAPRYYAPRPVYRYYPANYRTRPVYRYVYVYRNGKKVYRRSVVVTANGTRIYRTYSYNRLPPRHYYVRRVIVN